MKNKVIKTLMVLFVLGLLIPSVFADNPPTTPGIPEANYIKFTKVQIFWTESTDDVGVSGYKVYRDGVEVGDVTTASFSDTGLTAGTEYIYTVKAYDTLTQESTETDQLVLNTLAALTCDNAQDVMDAVDAVDPGGKTADELVTAVQNAFSNLGYDPTLDKVDRPLLIQMIEKQIDVINEPLPTPETPTTRAADQAEVDQLLVNNYEGNSFLAVYNNKNLAELAEKHFKDGKIDSALTIYDHSLEYLSDVPVNVYNTLSRMAVIELSTIDENYTTQQKIDTLNAAKDTLLRYFDYFPGSTDYYAQMIHFKAGFNYFQRFPEILHYNVYSQTVFDTAVAQIQAVKTMNDNPLNALRLQRINYWELTNVSVSIQDSSQSPLSGDITLENTSDSSRYFDDPVIDERTIAINSASEQVPLYLGHTYSVELSADIAGGNPWKFNFSNLPHVKGKKYTYNHSSGPVVTDLANTDDPAEIVFVVDPPTAPYNLTAQKSGDVFTLSWDWISPSGFTLKEFKVFRSGVNIGTVTTQTLANIPIEAGNHTYDYTVIAYDTNDNPSDESDALRVIPDFTAEQLAYYEWILLHFGSIPVYDDGDPDGDGITNYYEFLLGSDPNLSPVVNVRSTIPDAVAGIFTEYYQRSSGDQTIPPDFDALTPIGSEMLSKIKMHPEDPNALGNNLPDYVAVRMRGYIDAPSNGLYKFYVNTNNAVELFIDGIKVISDVTYPWFYELPTNVYLTEGTHSIEAHFFIKNGSSNFTTEWAGPGLLRCDVDDTYLWYTANPTDLLAECLAHSIDTDSDGVLDIVEYQLGTDVNSGDSDNDGISDFDEIYVYNTDPLSGDSDGDGFTDYEEVYIIFSDPNSVDIEGTVTEVASVNGSTGASLTGEWQTSGTSIYALSMNGSVEYTIDVPEDGVYRLAVEVTENNPYFNNSVFKLGLAVDDAFVANTTVSAPYGTVNDAQFYLPNLSAGEHTFRIIWNNTTFNTFIRINNLRLQYLAGADTDGNGIPDWIDNRLEQSTELTVPATTKTSPVCIEGNNHLNIGTLLISGYYTPEGEDPVDPVLKHSPDNKWYSDVTLNPDNPTVLDFDFQDGADSVQKTCEWIETNVLLDEDMEIRLGDSLLLTAFPEGAVSGTAVVTVEYEDHNIYYDINNTRNSFAHKFEFEGDYTISATYTPDDGGDPVTDTMDVKVVSSHFSYIPVAILNTSRNWANPGIADESIIEADTYIDLFEGAITGGGRNLEICVTQNKTGYVIARLGEDGPIMDSKEIRVLEINAPSGNRNCVLKVYPDGSVLIQFTIALSSIPEDLSIHLMLFTSGYMFEDGTVDKWLTAADFDEYGVCKYRIIKTPDATSGICHIIEIYQDDVLLQKY